MCGSRLALCKSFRRHGRIIEYGEDQGSGVSLLRASTSICGDDQQHSCNKPEANMAYRPWKPPRVAVLGAKVRRDAGYLNAAAITGTLNVGNWISDFSFNRLEVLVTGNGELEIRCNNEIMKA